MSSASQLLYGGIQGIRRNTGTIIQPIIAEQDPYFNLVPTLLRSEDSTGPSDIPNSGYFSNPYAITGSAGYTADKALPGKNKSLEFGEGSYLGLIAATASNPQSHNFCVEAWVYCDSNTTASDHILYSFSAAGFSSIATLTARDASGKARITIHTATVPTVVSASVIPLDTWVHLRFSKQAGECRIFINGVLDASSTDSSLAVNVAVDCYVGRGRASSGVVEVSAKMYVDSLRVTVGYHRGSGSFTPSLLFEAALTGLPKYPVYEMRIASLNISSPRIRELDFIGLNPLSLANAYAGSYSVANPPSYAFDSNASTYAINTTTVPNTLGYNFDGLGEEGPKSLEEFRVMVDQTYYSPKDFSIRHSYNQRDYTTMASYTVTSWPTSAYMDFVI